MPDQCAVLQGGDGALLRRQELHGVPPFEPVRCLRAGACRERGCRDAPLLQWSLRSDRLRIDDGTTSGVLHCGLKTDSMTCVLDGRRWDPGVHKSSESSRQFVPGSCGSSRGTSIALGFEARHAACNLSADSALGDR